MSDRTFNWIVDVMASVGAGLLFGLLVIGLFEVFA